MSWYNSKSIRAKIEKVDWKNVNVLFTALPNGEAQKIVKLIPKNKRIRTDIA